MQVPGGAHTLVAASTAILVGLTEDRSGNFVFPGQRRDKSLSNFPASAIGRVNVSNFPREITETALAHVIGDKAEQAYRRSDALEKRRKLMDAWAAYCEPKTSANVMQMRRRNPL
jgi:hypothetical protein